MYTIGYTIGACGGSVDRDEARGEFTHSCGLSIGETGIYDAAFDATSPLACRFASGFNAGRIHVLGQELTGFAAARTEEGYVAAYGPIPLGATMVYTGMEEHRQQLVLACQAVIFFTGELAMMRWAMNHGRYVLVDSGRSCLEAGMVLSHELPAELRPLLKVFSDVPGLIAILAKLDLRRVPMNTRGT